MIQVNKFDPIKALMKNTAPEIKRDEAAQALLKKYCMTRGIIGVNCGNMDPLAALHMIKGRIGDNSILPSEKGILNG